MPRENPAHGEPRPLERPRRVLPLPRAQRRAHARRLRARVRGRRAVRTTSSWRKLEQRLHLVPRYRQKLAFPPLGPGPPGLDRRPALQRPLPRAPHGAAGARGRGGAAQPGRADLRPGGSTAPSRCGRCGWSTASATTRFALITKTHHALVDGVSGVDISTVLFDLEPDPPEPDPAPPWYPRPEPSPAVLLAHVGGGARLGAAGRRPRRARRRAPSRARRRAAAARRSPGSRRWPPPGLAGAPPSPLNVRIGSHRRFAWVDARPRALQGDQVRARRHRQRRRARRRRGRAARVR